MQITDAGPLARVQVPDTPGAVYTVPAETIAQVSAILITNPSGDPVDVEVWLDGATNAYSLIPERSIAAGESWHFRTPMPLRAGTIINAAASAATSLTIFVMGTEVLV